MFMVRATATIVPIYAVTDAADERWALARWPESFHRISRSIYYLFYRTEHDREKEQFR